MGERGRDVSRETGVARKPRVLRRAEVTGVEMMNRDMVRVHFSGADLAAMSCPGTDAYIKILFAPDGVDYAWPFDTEEIKAAHPREAWPVTRTYTVRHHDADQQRMAVDFVVHGDEGLAGPWAQQAKPGDTIGFYGPGGAWSPNPDADHHLLVGDESAAPAIAAALDALPHDAAATVLLEVADEGCHLPLRALPHVDVRWVYRGGAPYGEALTQATLQVPFPEGRVAAFVHGNADMIKELRRYLFVERGLQRSDVSISGYWRTGHTEDRWQATKRDFVARMEAEQDGIVSTQR